MEAKLSLAVSVSDTSGVKLGLESEVWIVIFVQELFKQIQTHRRDLGY